MKRYFIPVLLIAAAGLGAWYFFLKEPSFATTEGFLTNVDKTGVIIDGYDPITYFTENKPVRGNPAFSFHHDGATYWFASKKNRDDFKATPQKFAPQYGAFCGYAVSIGKLRPVDPTIFQIEGGRLILQHTKEAFVLFNKDLKGSVVKADANWPALVSNHVGKPVQYDKPASQPVAAQ